MGDGQENPRKPFQAGEHLLFGASLHMEIPPASIYYLTTQYVIFVTDLLKETDIFGHL